MANEALDDDKVQLAEQIAHTLTAELPELLARTKGGYRISIHILPGHKEARIEFQPKIITVRQSSKK